MIIGVPKEIKSDENRVALVPAGASHLGGSGHTVLVQHDAGIGSCFTNADYEGAGAKIVRTAKEVYERAEMIVKVKEPLPKEFKLIRKDQVIFTYFHFAADVKLTRGMMDSGAVCIAYETIQKKDGSLPLLVPMSEVAGRMAVQEGAKYLERVMGGQGILLGGVPGVLPANVTVLGGGVVGTNSAKIAAGMGAKVIVLDVNLERLRYLEDVLPKNVFFMYSNRHNILSCLPQTDLLIGAVLLPGAKAPKLVQRKDLALMREGSVIVDVAVDQGGCIETVRPTTHSKPTYAIDGVVHYCVANMPGSVPRTSTLALTNATFPYARLIADRGWKKAASEDETLALGLNMIKGKVTHPAVAEAFGLPYVNHGKLI